MHFVLTVVAWFGQPAILTFDYPTMDECRAAKIKVIEANTEAIVFCVAK